jgi:hypothetical protein
MKTVRIEIQELDREQAQKAEQLLFTYTQVIDCKGWVENKSENLSLGMECFIDWEKVVGTVTIKIRNVAGPLPTVLVDWQQYGQKSQTIFHVIHENLEGAIAQYMQIVSTYKNKFGGA